MRPREYDLIGLYHDWRNECEYCPENDACISGITFYNNNTGQVFCAEISGQLDFTFEDLMHMVENVLGLR